MHPKVWQKNSDTCIEEHGPLDNIYFSIILEQFPQYSLKPSVRCLSYCICIAVTKIWLEALHNKSVAVQKKAFYIAIPVYFRVFVLYQMLVN